MSIQQNIEHEPEADATVLLTPPRRAGRGRLTLRRFARNKLALVGIGILVLLFLFAYVGPLVDKWGYNDHDFTAFLEGPSGNHWFGTDQSGTDMFALTTRGLQKSLVIGILVGIIATALAATAGASAGYFGGWVDRAIMWVVDLLLVLPAFLIVAVLSPVFAGSTWLVFVVLLAIFSWMITARIVRSMTLTLKDREFVKAAKYMGVSDFRIIVRHILPSMASLLIIDGTIQVSLAVIGESQLSYFGFGIQAPDVSLGTVIADGTSSATTYQWLFWFPAGFLVLFGLAIAFIGDGLRDAYDPNSANAKAQAKAIKNKDREPEPAAELVGSTEVLSQA
ncbi:ABC transporter permease [Streptacidiphilus sp. N1-12]|uniref:Oligopeptide transport system permease protein OppC n=2 Tax=Streptacidiphilus alkalitolerans TaxID=3342712 RepID=A0ABV6WLP0_9ACTN